MKSFCIVHLSDLHISDREDGKTSNLRNALIRDLVDRTQSQSLKIDAIAVTGDSVDRGGSVGAFQIAEEYYKQLIHALNIEKENVLFVPGNHDYPRRTAIQVLLENTSTDDFYNKTLFTEHWETFQARQKSFQKMVCNVTGVNDLENTEYGGSIRTIQTDNGLIRFVLLNSSWACTGERDFSNLFVGKWQLDELINLNRKLPPANLVLGLMHHPIDWLNIADQKLVVENLTQPHGINLDAILHGHIHTGRLDYTLNPDRGLLSLVSGVGYPDKSNRGIDQFKVSNCRYAIYNFDADSGMLTVQLRVSNENGSFAADTLLYDLGKETGSFTIPYKLKLSLIEQGSALEKK
ncbi:metallophosphoesterase [Paenibacillus sp. HWE-109]|uniref:metallophosphoesterase family protein n=1 Tax=Paenibacillus sp. HWE-109 TaxID=1306526 RepID=UPI001EDF9942|nr:metallophosphoesterase [Paenibacillus sp. HWE-109]UKS27295.1 metallophosphoesterase [Paenibacillus sp. HWE-109]